MFTRNESNGRHKGGFCVQANRSESYEIVYSPNLLSNENPSLASVLRQGPTLVVTTPTVERHYGKRLRQYLKARCPKTEASIMTLPCSESRKGIEQVLEVCSHAASAMLGRRSQLVAMGGGVCTDICGLAAALYRRGIPHVRVPTTLLGLIDAGIGAKSGINFLEKKSMLGTFSPPEYCMLDPTFLASLPRRNLKCGLAESLKMGIAACPDLFALLEEHGRQLLIDNFKSVGPIVEAVVGLSVESMLRQLSDNLFERSYRRTVDFGHTFSAYFEEASFYSVLHGEAVALDMALSAQIAFRLHMLDDRCRSRIIRLLNSLELPVVWPGANTRAMYAALDSVVRHRDGKLNLVLPTGIGRCVFVEDLSQLRPNLIETALQDLCSQQGTHQPARRADTDTLLGK